MDVQSGVLSGLITANSTENLPAQHILLVASVNNAPPLMSARDVIRAASPMKNLCKSCDNFVPLKKLSNGLCNEFHGGKLIIQRLQMQKQVFVIQCDFYNRNCERCKETIGELEPDGCRDPDCPFI